MRIRYVLASAALTSVLGTIERIKQQGEQKAREYDGRRCAGPRSAARSWADQGRS